MKCATQKFREFKEQTFDAILYEAQENRPLSFS